MELSLTLYDFDFALPFADLVLMICILSHIFPHIGTYTSLLT
jgi:hypothetical protein